MKNKKLILLIVGFALFLGIVYIGYNKLSNAYSEKLKAEEKLASDNILNNGGVSIVETKDKAIDFTVYDENNNKVKLSDHIGTPIILNFWASWCPPCKAEMPYFQAASKEYSKDDVKILMVNMTDGQRETKDLAMKFMKDNNYDMTMLLDIDSDVAYKYKLSAIPRTIFIDRDGNIVEDKVGVVTKDYLNGMIEKLLSSN
ncbi:MAG: TlpA disulfide reductase family protein [Clostridium sp.]|uniref:TlpA family protein disulfide reductase n=1 Tax=Clostridium sp. TaxID=1506 RepID=UPI00304E3569